MKTLHRLGFVLTVFTVALTGLTCAAQEMIFANWLSLDLRLAPSSPAIDTGNTDGATSHDIDGIPRDAQPDIGAHEFVAP